MNELEIMMSNAIRGDYKDKIIEKTVNEIHDDMTMVFGPFANDAFITKDQQPYFTRDGKEIISSLRFNNELSMYILKIIYQAVYDQAKAVGDGTTTVAVFYTNLYRALVQNYPRTDNTVMRANFNRSGWLYHCKNWAERIRKRAVPMTKEKMRSVLLTCTQDTELSEKIYNNLADPIMNQAYIVINKSNIETDFNMTVNHKPLIHATRQYSLKPINTVEHYTTIFHCNGILDLGHPELLFSLISYMKIKDGNYIPKTVVLLCNGVSERTRNTLKEFTREVNQMVSEGRLKLEDFSNLAIYTLDDYRSYTTEEVEDISTIITDEYGIGGMVNQLTFESLLYQALHNPEAEKIEDLETFDCDIRHITKTKELMNEDYEVEFDDVNGIKINKDLGPIAQARYDDLRKQLEEEKSEVKKVALNRRLRNMYGEFIEIEVGSKLIKDSQHKYELILDAVLSCSDAVRNGILEGNSILVAIEELYHYIEESTYENLNELSSVLLEATVATFLDLIKLSPAMETTDHMESLYILGKMLGICKYSKYFYMIPYDMKYILHKMTLEVGKGKIDPKSIQYTELESLINQDRDIVKQFNGEDHISEIVEPVSIITNMIENSTVICDLYLADTYHMEGLLRNYI